MIPLFDGKVESGKLILWNPEDFKRHYQTFEGKPIQLSIQRAINKRTTQQNKYLWGIVYKVLSKETGHEPEELHEFFKLKFNPQFIQVLNKTTGEADEEMISGSTRKMDIQDFIEFVDKIQHWAITFLDVIIPDANQVSEGEKNESD